MTPAQLDALLTVELNVQRIARGEAPIVEPSNGNEPQFATFADAMQLASMRLAGG